MLRIVITTDQPTFRRISALKSVKIESVMNAEERSRRISKESARKVYEHYRGGASQKSTATKFGISTASVLRIVLNPTSYGVQGEPLRRTIRGHS